MDESLRNRAKSQFPSVLLTLSSVIQAMALETLWSRISDLARPSGFSAIPLEAWLQALALLLAIVVLWIYYAQLVMRLVWIPRLTDSLIPFALGIGQFLEADTLGNGAVASWLAPFPVMFLLCHLSWVWTLARAREESENALLIEAFLQNGRLARDGPMWASIALLAAMGVVVWILPGAAIGALVCLNLLLILQIVLQGIYWRRSLEPAQ